MSNQDSLYARRGVSAQKEEVHAATASLNQGLFPKAFCKVYPDFLAGDAKWVNVMHADGAGTKSILAYLYWRQTGDLSVWKGIAQDAIVMNLDDLLCAGVHDNIVFNSTIDRNKSRIPGEVIKAIIEGTDELFASLRSFGINIRYLGGETADVGDVVRTVAVNGTMTARWPADKIITNEKISAGDVIVGLASSGQTVYESAFNSGIGSNGLTSARHDVLGKFYARFFPETFEPSLDPAVVYIGKYQMTDVVIDEAHTVGQLLLSPTRTYGPFMKKMLVDHFDKIHGLVHCSGGGQTKCMKFLPAGVSVLKDNLFDVPYVFQMIQECSGAPDSEMFQVFNMGCRLEIYCDPSNAETFIEEAQLLGIEAKIIGKVENAGRHKLSITTPGKKQINYGG